MSSSHDEEKAALMEGRDSSQDSDSIEEIAELHSRTRSSFWKTNRRSFIFHASLIMIYTAIFWLASVRSKHSHTQSLVYSPAEAAVQFKKQRFAAELVIESEYIGEPSAESDLAWHTLLQNMNIAVPAADLETIGAKSILVPGEHGMFIAGLSVYHELHCLKRLRQHTWSDVYFPNQTAEDMRLNRLHTDHCIDVLRQAILCRADISLFTLQWSEAQTMPRADFSHEHQCVDWEVLNEWAGQRAVPDEKMKLLKHPLHGPAFPDGKGTRLGASEDHSPTVYEHSTS